MIEEMLLDSMMIFTCLCPVCVEYLKAVDVQHTNHTAVVQGAYLDGQPCVDTLDYPREQSLICSLRG